MTGLSAEFEYPSQKANVKPQPLTQHGGISSGAKFSQIGLENMIIREMTISLKSTMSKR